MNEQLFTIIISIFASTGFWTTINILIQKHDAKTSNRDQLLLGLAHDRICWLGEHYIKQGYISKDDYEGLHDYLYKPYEALGGNGTAKKIMNEVNKLPLKEEKI